MNKTGDNIIDDNYTDFVIPYKNYKNSKAKFTKIPIRIGWDIKEECDE